VENRWGSIRKPGGEVLPTFGGQCSAEVGKSLSGESRAPENVRREGGRMFPLLNASGGATRNDLRAKATSRRKQKLGKKEGNSINGGRWCGRPNTLTRIKFNRKGLSERSKAAFGACAGVGELAGRTGPEGTEGTGHESGGKNACLSA